MRLDEIKSAVSTEIRGDVDTLLKTWCTEIEGDPEDPDAERFLAWLYQEGHIGGETFRELHAGGALKLARFDTMVGNTFFRSTFFPDDITEDTPTEELTADPTSEGEVPETGIARRYTFLGKVGEGAMGEIHVAKDRDLQRKIAFKQMTRRVANHPAMSARFYVEAQITAQLDHPNIVPVHALEQTDDGRLAYTMKLIRGSTLQDIIEDVRSLHDSGKELPRELRLSARVEHFLKVCDALDYAHSRGVVHRDLKPENIMVGPFNEVYVMDWGIARVLDADDLGLDDSVDIADGGTGGLKKTRMGTIMGTPAYMSPEQADGRNDELDARSDQFSLGLILYELVSLQRAVAGDTAMHLVAKIQNAALEPLVHYAKEPIPRELHAIISKATQLEPDDRYGSVRDLADDLKRYVRGDEIHAAPDRGLQRVWRWINNHRLFAAMSVAAILLSAALAVIGTLLYNFDAMARAEQREARLAHLLTTVARQGATIDGQLTRYEGLLDVIAESAVTALEEPGDVTLPTFLAGDDFEPPDLGASKRYGRPISTDWPVLRTPRTVSVGETHEDLVALRHTMRRALLSSRAEDALGRDREEQRVLLADQGTPIAVAHVALADGSFVAFPGHGGYPPGFAPQKQPWYQLSEDARGAAWGNPHVDVGNLGLLLPCSRRLVSRKGEFLGVAAVEVTFDSIIDELLEAGDLQGRSEAFLVNEKGRIVLRSSEKGRQIRSRKVGVRKLRLKRFPVPKLAKVIKHSPSGWFEVDEDGVGQIVLFYKMETLGWFYVVKGEAAALLHR